MISACERCCCSAPSYWGLCCFGREVFFWGVLDWSSSLWWWGFFAFFFFSPLLWHFSQLIHRPRSSPASVLFTFVVGSRCVHSFMQTNCSGTYIVRTSLGHGRRTALAAFTETSWLVLPAQPPRAFCVRGHLCLLSLLCSGYGTCAVSPFQGEGKTTFSWRADE